MGPIQSGWVANVPHLRSPNFNERPVNTDISLLVIHGISLPEYHYESSVPLDLFTNQIDFNAYPDLAYLAELSVSPHFFIARDGKLCQLVSLDKRAWHAGQSSFKGVENCNDYSIGIEVEGSDRDPYEPCQYQTLNQLIARLRAEFPAITSDRIVGHSDIAPGRKRDPWPTFDWQQLSKRD